MNVDLTKQEQEMLLAAVDNHCEKIAVIIAVHPTPELVETLRISETLLDKLLSSLDFVPTWKPLLNKRRALRTTEPKGPSNPSTS